MGGNAAQPGLEELILEAVRGELARAHVALPAKIVSYDQATQTATVQPTIRARYRDERGQSTPYQLPSIAKVPVAFPAGGGFSITWPLAVGDKGLLLVVERSLDEWKATDGDDCTPQDPRRFDLTDCTFIPALRSPAAPLTEVLAGAMVIAGAEIRLGSKTAAQAFVLGTAFKTLYNAHTHATGVGPSGPPVVLMDAAPGTHLSLKIKGE